MTRAGSALEPVHGLFDTVARTVREQQAPEAVLGDRLVRIGAAPIPTLGEDLVARGSRARLVQVAEPGVGGRDMPGRGFRVKGVGAAEISRYALTAHVQVGERRLRMPGARGGCPFEPSRRLARVGGAEFAVPEHVAEGQRRLHAAGALGPFVPVPRGGRVRRVPRTNA